MNALVAPSVLAADFLHLGHDIDLLNRSDADLIHLDIMDGHLVPNISFGFPVVKAIASISRKPLDAHLMVTEPYRWIDTLSKSGVSMISFHLEAMGRQSSSFIDKLHSMGFKAGVAIDPDVKVQRLFPLIVKADYFLIMSVFAGFGGQKFIYESLDRISELKSEIIKRNASALIEVDGGVDMTNAASLKEAGADILVAGSSVFSDSDPESVISGLKNA